MQDMEMMDIIALQYSHIDYCSILYPQLYSISLGFYFTELYITIYHTTKSKKRTRPVQSKETQKGDCYSKINNNNWSHRYYWIRSGENIKP